MVKHQRGDGSAGTFDIGMPSRYLRVDMRIYAGIALIHLAEYGKVIVVILSQQLMMHTHTKTQIPAYQPLGLKCCRIARRFIKRDSVCDLGKKFGLIVLVGCVDRYQHFFVCCQNHISIGGVNDVWVDK